MSHGLRPAEGKRLPIRTETGVTEGTEAPRRGRRRFARDGRRGSSPLPDAALAPPGSRPRHSLPLPLLLLMRPLFRYSAHRDAYVLRVVGNRYGPVLRRHRRRG